jgi:hypothetical protein
LEEYAGARGKGGELPVVTLARREDAGALGTPADRRSDTFAALLDAVYNPARRMAASWDLKELAAMAHVLQMDSLLFLNDGVGACELANRGLSLPRYLV